jgi:LysM domain-containing protein
MPEETPSQARLLAPIALGLVAFAFLVVVISSGGSGDGGRKDERSPSSTKRHAAKPKHPRGQRDSDSTYKVKTGDTLAGIAEKTGLSVEKLQELNPELDPQALVTGQKVKLRE